MDGGTAAISKQRGFTLVRPDDGWFPGLGKLREELASHAWIFGKTPKFKVRGANLFWSENLGVIFLENVHVASNERHVV